MCMCESTYICILMHTYAYVSAYISVLSIRMHMVPHTYVYLCKRMHMFAYLEIYVYPHTYVRGYTHT